MRYGTEDEQIAALVKAAIASSGQSQESVRLAAGISDGVWQRAIRHGNDSLRVTALIRIANVLDIDVTALMPQQSGVAA